MDASFPPTYIHLGLSFLQERKHAEAVAAMEKAVTLSRGDPAITGFLAYTLAASGQRDRVQELVQEIETRRKRGETVAMALAIAYTGLGEPDRAFRWLDQACQERTWLLGTLPSEPLFDPLRSDPRFHSLLRRLHLAP